MPKSLFIAEKPSVARAFAAALKEPMDRREGYLESENALVTWCVGHLISMSYPEVYDPALHKWQMETLPFMPEQFRYEVIEAVRKQFDIVKALLNREDVKRIYVCTDAGREGEYIYRLVEQEAGVKTEDRRRVWIDSQTEEEIQKGIREAKPLAVYDNLAAAAYLRAKEDYLMGINFSRVLAIKYGYALSDFLGQRAKLAVGRVMTCVLGMVVKREREIRDFDKTPFYRLQAVFFTELFDVGGDAPIAPNQFAVNPGVGGDAPIDPPTPHITAEWRVTPESSWFESPALYKENGFKREADALTLKASLAGQPAHLASISRKKEKNQPPLLFNLAELQNICAKQLKLSPDETLNIAQELYEKKLITYPRTDARVLSSAVAKEIKGNISGLGKIADVAPFVQEILENQSYQDIGKSRYTNDKMITDHYAIIPTGQGLGALAGLPEKARKVYERIVRRFLSVFYPPAVYEKTALEILLGRESFFANFKSLQEPGYLKVVQVQKEAREENASEDEKEEQDGEALKELLAALKKGQPLYPGRISIKEGETTPPKRYNSGSLILAMENAGQLIEDEELRAQIKGSGIGTSATRAEILKKLVSNQYLNLNAKTQIVTPTLLGEMIHDTVYVTIRSLLDPTLTANWEKGLAMVAEGKLSEAEYMDRLRDYVSRQVEKVKTADYRNALKGQFARIASAYQR